jgi:hypothetical protein
VRAALLLLAARVQVPEPPAPEEVQWIAPPECPGREALLEGVAKRRGQPLAPGQARVIARASVAGSRYRLELELDVGGRRESRVLTARSCKALVDAAALRIVLAVEAEQSGGAVEPVEPVGEEGEAVAAEEPAVPAEGPAQVAQVPVEPYSEPVVRAAEPPAPVEARRRAPGGFLRLAGVGEYGALPGVTGGGALAGGLLWRYARVELRATYLAPRESARTQPAVRASLLAGALVGCGRVGRGALEVAPCAGIEVGGMSGSAEIDGERARMLGSWVAGLLEVAVAYRVRPRLGLWASLSGLAALRWPRYVLQDPGPERILFDPGVVSGRLSFGVELRFGDPR